ncbi:MAG: VanZ family protein [Clostridiales bacterium]|nr:VanZ family protein [Clostridiales bacterium]
MRNLTTVQKKHKYYRTIRGLTIASLVLAIVLCLIILIEGATPAELSAKQSNFVSDVIKSVLKREDKPEVMALAGISISAESGFTDESTQMDVDYLPSGAAPCALTFTSSNLKAATVSEDGVITYVGYGKSTITAESASGRFKTSTVVECYGTNPKHITDLSVNKTILTQGTRTTLALYDQNGNRVKTSIFKIKSDNKSVLKIDGSRTLGLSEGTANVTFSHKKSNFSRTVKFTVNENPDFVIPESFAFESDVLNVTVGDTFDLDKLLTAVTPNGASTLYTTSVDFADDVETIEWQSANRYEVQNAGRATITVTSCFNPACTATLTINSVEAVPTSLSIVSRNSRLVIGKSYTLKAYGDSGYVDCVNWQIIRGKAKINDSGIITSNLAGKITVRATSTLDPTVYADIDLEFALFQNFKSMVRTMVGHLGLFMLFGICLSLFLFLVVKPRGIYPLITLGCGFIVGIISELLQMPTVTTGRYASWTDVLIDTSGTFCGIAITSIVILLYVLIKKKFRGDDFTIVSNVFSSTHGTTAFRRHGKLIATDDSEYKRK